MATKETPENSVTKSYSFQKWVRNSVAMPLTLAAGLAVNGCRTASFENATKEGRELHNIVLTEQLHKQSLTDFVDKNFKGLLSNVKIEEIEQIKSVPPEAENDYKTRLALAVTAGKVADSEKVAFEEMFKINQDLEKLQSGMGLQRYVIKVLLDNTDADLEAFRVTKLPDGQAQKVMGETLTDLKTHLKDLTFDERKSLDAKFNSNIEFEVEKDGKKQTIKLSDEEYRKIRAYNVDGLKTVDGLLISAASSAMHEGKLSEVDTYSGYSAHIILSLAGIDQYAQGKKVLDAILDNYTIGDITKGRETSQLADRFNKDTKLRDAYNALLEAVTEEAKSGSYESSDTIVNKHGYHILNMLAQAHMNGNFQYVVDGADGKKEVKQGNHLFGAANKYALSEIVNAVSRANTRESGIQFWGTAFSVLPFSSFYKVIENIEQACTSNWYDPGADDARKALLNVVEDGSLARLGFKNASHFVGDNSAATTYVIVGGISSLAQIAGVVYGFKDGGFIDKLIHRRNDNNVVNPNPTVPPFGGGGITQPPIK